VVFLGALVTPEGNDWAGAFQGLFAGNGWPLDNSSIIKQITLAGLRGDIAAATDAAVLENLEKKLLYITGARLLLISTFLGIAGLVYLAYTRRVKEGRI